MDSQAKKAREQMKSLPFREKWENFWFYYKKHVIVIIFTLIVVVTSVVQCANRINYDLTISYYTSNGVFSEGITKLEELMKGVALDTNDNEVVDIGVSLSVADPEQMSEQTQAVGTKLMTEMAAGEAMGYMFDDKYKEIALMQNDELADTILKISAIPEIRQMLGITDVENLYWVTKTVYETEKDKEERLKEHENAVRVEKMFIEMGAEIVKK